MGTVMPKTGKAGGPRKTAPNDERTATLDFTPTVAAMCEAMTYGDAREIMCVGTRGDGKTIGVLAGMISHASEHHSAVDTRTGAPKESHPLPTKWIGFTDTFTSHKNKTFESLQKPMWKGCWRESDGGHVWTAVVNGREMVKLHLFGIEDQGAMDRVRTECVGVWAEEPAPTAMMGVSTGVDVSAWGMAMTSQRVPTHARVAVMTLNYPDEDHWTWQRFHPSSDALPELPEDPALRESYYRTFAKQITGRTIEDHSRLWFRIPPGERAGQLQRDEWKHALRDRPDLLRRLVSGQPGSIMLGPQVADGFSMDTHVSKTRLHPVPGEPMLFGLDFGLTPSMVIGQYVKGYRRIYAAFTLEHGGVAQLLENEVLPWLVSHAHWVLRNPGMVCGCYDIAGQTGEQSDIERDPITVVEKKLPGLWFPGPINWESRKHTLISSFHHTVKPGEVSVQIDPVDAVGLIRALSGRWHYPIDRQGQVRRELPKKPNHPWEDYGDAYIYWLWGLTSDAQPPGPMKVETQFSLDQSIHVETTIF